MALAAVVLGLLVLSAALGGKLDLNGGASVAPSSVVQLPETATASPSSAPTPVITPSPEPTVAPTEAPPPPTPEPTPEPPPEPAPEPAPTPEPIAAAAPPGPPCGGPPYLTWVWRFSTDGPASQIAATLSQHRGGVILKTHDGVDWMSKWDPSPDAVTGPQKVAALAHLFESAGIPFHAWAVVEGRDPIKEAQMASEVLAAGARSLTLDLEPWPAFWEGTRETARAYGEELRRLQPDATIITSVDARPWTLNDVPLDEFAAFSNALAPMVYWDTYETPENRAGYAQSGFPPPEEKASPEFFLNVSAAALGRYGLPIKPVGYGSPEENRWARFIDHAALTGMPEVSIWRYGVIGSDTWSLLGDRTPSGQLYVVQPGDTLSRIGGLWGVDAGRIAIANRLADPNLLYIGQELCVPLG